MATTSDERWGLFMLLIAAVAVGVETHSASLGVATFFAFFGPTLAIRSWIQPLTRTTTREGGE
jgi:hypothetical protein